MTTLAPPAVESREANSTLTNSEARLAGMTLLRRYQRRLLFTGAGLISAGLLCAALGLAVTHAARYHDERVQGLERARSALVEAIEQRRTSDIRLTNMAEYAWKHPMEVAAGEMARRRELFLAGGERLMLAADPQSAPQMALGMGTSRWAGTEIDRYLQLSTSLSLIVRLTRVHSDGASRPAAFFFDPSGHYLSLGEGLTERSLKHALGVEDRGEVFSRLREQAGLLAPASNDDGLPTLQALTEGARLQLRFNRHPLTGEPSLVATSFALDDGRPVAAFVTFEPASRLQRALRMAGGGSPALMTPRGECLLTAVGSCQADRDPGSHHASPRVSAGVTSSLDQGMGRFRLTTTVPGTNWLLVDTYTLSSMLSSAYGSVMAATLVLVALLAAVWILAGCLDRRSFKPLFEQTQQLLSDDQLLVSMMASGVAGLCTLGGQGVDVLGQNSIMATYAERYAQSGMTLHERLWKEHGLRVREAGTIVEFEIPLDDDLDGEPQLLLVRARASEHQGAAILHVAACDMSLRAAMERREVRARRHAEAENRAKSSFLAAMTHEIRTPLFGMLGHLELLERSGLDTSQRARSLRVRESADSLLDIVNDVLDLTRIEFGQMNIVQTLFEPAQLLERVALLYAPLAQAKGLDLDYVVGPTVPACCVGPEEALERVLRNLASNAVKFTRSGRVQLRVACTSQSGVPAALRFEIADSGIGLDAVQRQRLFQPFTQADETIQGRFGGSGLGLSLCRQLCDAMQGSIAVDSTPDVGSLFTVEVPVEKVARPLAPRPLRGMGVALLAAPPSWRGEMVRCLREWGCSPQAYCSVEEWLGASRDTEVRIVFEKAGAPLTEPCAVDGPLVRIRVDGPLHPVREGQAWVLSSYASAALRALLEEIRDGRAVMPLAALQALG